MKVTNTMIEKLITNIEEKMKDELVVIYTLRELLSIIEIDESIAYYIDINEFLNDIRKHNKMLWHKLTFVVKDRKIVFFKFKELIK